MTFEPNPPSQETIMRVLTLSEFEYTDYVWWRNDDEGRMRFFVTCSDVFYWGGSDLEEITDENIGELEAAVAECETIAGKWRGEDGFILFVVRQRKLRPQGAYYPAIDSELHHLFHAAAPERQVGMGNPKPAPAVTV